MKILYIFIILLILPYAKEPPLDLNKTIVSLDNNSDNLNFCLAISEKDLKYCSEIEDKDEKSLCFGILQRNSGHCATIVNEDIKNKCLSIALSDIKYCEQIKDEKMKNNCNVFYIKNESEKKQDTCK